MVGAIDADEQLEAPATADDLYKVLAQAEFASRHDAAALQRVRRVAKLFTPVMSRLLRPRYVLAPTPDGECWLLGELGDVRTCGGAPRGVELAHRILAVNRRLTPYTDLGESSPKAAAMAITRARAWLAARCPAVARALSAIECAEEGVRLDVGELNVELVTGM